MAWVKLDDGFAQHPKVVAAGPVALAMQVAGLCFCNRYLTDGHLPANVVPMLLPLGDSGEVRQVIASLLKHGLWAQVEDGYQIHDYLKYQPSRQEVMALRESRREAGRKGGLSKRDSIARRLASAKHSVSKTSSKTPSETEAKLYPDPDPDPLTKDHVHPPTASERSAASVKQANRYSQIFEDWWDGYPRKVRKKAAHAAWKARLREGLTVEDLTVARDAYRQDCERRGTSPDYILHGGTFLGPRRPFEDYLSGEVTAGCQEQREVSETQETIRRLYKQAGKTPPS